MTLDVARPMSLQNSARCKKTSARWRTIVLDGGLWLLYQYFAKNALGTLHYKAPLEPLNG